MKNIVNTGFQLRGGVKLSSNATFPDLIKRFFERFKKKCCELSLVNSELTTNKQANDNKVDSPLTTHNSLVKAIAFTLAETLVVMGIIGVVAALTIPNLNQSTGDREKVAKVKKIYSNLEDAFGRATAVYGPLENWFVNDGNDNTVMTNRFADRITEFMKISKSCEYEGSGCLASAYKMLGATPIVSPRFDPAILKKFLLADGTGIGFYYIQGSSMIFVDIDSVKGSNIYGKDYFLFDIDENNGIVPSGSNCSNSDLISYCFQAGFACTGWVINNENMDYLKVDGNGRCPNGTTLSWENTTCK